VHQASTDHTLEVDEYFPSAEEIAARAREAEARPTAWRSENLKIAHEFLAKMADAGIEPPPAEYGSFTAYSVRGWTTPGYALFLDPGPPPCWWKVSRFSVGPYEFSVGPYETDTSNEQINFEDLEWLCTWDPVAFRECLALQIPR
jgi:hypothetical protein